MSRKSATPKSCFISGTHSEIRELSINKGAKLVDYDKAFGIMKEYGVEILTYVLMKPAFIGERKAIEDTIETIRYAFNTGAASVSIEPVSVQDNTVIDLLNKAGTYRTPWTWSLFEVLRATHDLGDVRAGGFEFFPAPREFVHNCEMCDEVCYDALREYNKSGSVVHFSDIKCDCRAVWKKQIETSGTSDYYGRICEDIASAFAYVVHNYHLSID